MASNESFIEPDWPAPVNVRSLTTTRLGGVSQAPYDSFNLGQHVNDSHINVVNNRRKLAEQCQLNGPALQWLNQVHGIDVCEAASDSVIREADATYSKAQGVACVIMTADCLPILLCNKQGTQVAAVHAGWRSLSAGVIEATLNTFADPSNVLAWLGPSIGPNHFEVGPDVVDAFKVWSIDTKISSSSIERAFSPSVHHKGKWLADLCLLARIRLHSLGVNDVYSEGGCTYSDEARFYSYRRDGQTGRMASLIWLA